MSSRPSLIQLARYSIQVESRAQAQAIQTFLWCLWLAALSRTVSTVSPTPSPCNVVYDNGQAGGNGNITQYTRPANASIPGADGATLNLTGYTAFNLPTAISKTVSGNVTASAVFSYDAGYQRIRQTKRSGPAYTGDFAADILYVVPSVGSSGFEVHRDAAGKIIRSIATVSGADGAVASVTTNFDPASGLSVAATGTSAYSGANTITQLILKDHLGSMVADYNLGTGALVIHGYGPWGNSRNGASPNAEGNRGFTGHEHLADLGIVHMNGRLYDPVLGRFLQADPIIQAPHNAQSHNRYAYVLNNPLSFTDPSGFSAWTQWRSTIFAIVAAVFMQYYLMPYLLLGTAFGQCGIYAAAGNAMTAVASGFAAGGIAGGNIQSALQGALTAGVTFGLASGFDLHGAAAFGSAQHAGQIALHAAMGCASSAMAGGSCKSGAISGGTSAFASPLLPANRVGRLLGSSIVGAIASALSGGKAANGALTAAFSYLFNEVAGMRMIHTGYDKEKGTTVGRLEVYLEGERDPRIMSYTSGRGTSDSSVPDNGPTPPGWYWAPPALLQNMSVADRITGTNQGAYEMSALNLLRVSGQDWGAFRIPMLPQDGSEAIFGRTNIYLHGGSWPGSAGCIDVGSVNQSWLAAEIRATKVGIPIVVERRF